MKKTKILSILVFIQFCIVGTLMAQTFEHPGIFNRECDFARMRQKIAEHAEPWYTTWNNLLSSPESQISWAGPRAVATVIRGGTGDNISLMYRDVAAAYQDALIYKISGDKAHGDKAVQILNAWASINTLVSGNSDRYLASGLDGYQFANAAEMMRGYPGFNIEKFKSYMLNVFFYPMNERFLIGNAWGAPHNDACATNYRVNWDACNMDAMLAISILCDNKTGFDEAINYCKSGDGTGNITRAVNFLYPNSPTSGANIWGQWEESGRDQGHATGGMGLYGIFCEIAWNQGIDMYGYDNDRFRKGAEYVARYNIMKTDNTNTIVGKYEDLPYTTYSRLMGSNCSWYTENVLGESGRGKLGACWEMIYNHYARRLNQGDKVKSLYEMLQQQQSWSRSWPTLNVHADTYDTPGGGGLTFCADSGSYILPWSNMDISARSIVKLQNYGKSILQDSMLTIIGSGSGLQGTVDQFQYAYQKLVDDGSIETQITSLDEVNTLCQAGLMIRDNLEQNSANLFLSMSAAQGIILSSRDSMGLATTNIVTNAALNNFPYWLRLSRSGDVINAEISSNHINWEEVGSKTIKMSRQIYVGLAVSSKNVNEICTAVFNKTNVRQGNIRPIVKIYSPGEVGTSYVTPANVKIYGTAYDVDGLLDRVEIYVNDSIIYSTKVSPFTYNLTRAPEGNYSVYVKCFDRQGAVTISDTVRYVVNPVTTKLPWYKFDETKTGYTAADASGNSMSAFLYGGATPASGKINQCIKLNGVGQYIKVPNGAIERLSDFTISAWVNMDTIATWSRIFDFGSSTSVNMFLAATDNNGKIQFSITPASGTVQTVTTSSSLPLKIWNFVTVTLDVTNKVCIYLDGILVGTSLSFTNRPYDLGATTANFIGKSQWAADPYFKGYIDDFRFYNYAMTINQVNEAMALTPIHEIKTNSTLFYPNPAKNEIHLVNSENSVLKIYDTLGKLVFHQQITSPNQSIDIRTLTQGVYIVKTTDMNLNQYQNKLILQ
ncbi:MAG: LamG-like jellyroll fold domain-containing protein [Paludibacter sp.]